MVKISASTALAVAMVPLKERSHWKDVLLVVRASSKLAQVLHSALTASPAAFRGYPRPRLVRSALRANTAPLWALVSALPVVLASTQRLLGAHIQMCAFHAQSGSLRVCQAATCVAAAIRANTGLTLARIVVRSAAQASIKEIQRKLVV
jgi:hypothetical protein